MRRSTMMKTVGILTIVASAAALQGCASEYPRMNEFASEPTPELQTLALRPVDVKGELSRNLDSYGRQFNRDLGSLFLLDRPTRLQNMPMVD